MKGCHLPVMITGGLTDERRQPWTEWHSWRWTSTAVVMNRDAGILAEERVPHEDPRELAESFSRFEPGTDVLMEATFNWPWIADLAEKAGLSPHLGDPMRLRNYAKGLAKSDRKDAIFEGKLWAKGRVAVAREMLELVHLVLSRKAPYTETPPPRPGTRARGAAPRPARQVSNCGRPRRRRSSRRRERMDASATDERRTGSEHHRLKPVAYPSTEVD